MPHCPWLFNWVVAKAFRLSVKTARFLQNKSSKSQPGSIRNRKNELELSGYHPLGWEDTEAFLKAFIQTVSPIDGEFLDAPGSGVTTNPRLWRDPVLFLRKRVAGIANAVDAIIDDIEHQEFFPPALGQITGTMEEWSGTGLSQSGDEIAVSAIQPAMSDDDILLAKEANEEQLQIIRRLHRSGSVIVQGPPGTGKTHTIGNLIGHLLAQGKSILVTAQTASRGRCSRPPSFRLARLLLLDYAGDASSTP